MDNTVRQSQNLEAQTFFEVGLHTVGVGIRIFRAGLRVFETGLRVFETGLRTFGIGLRTFGAGLHTLTPFRIFFALVAPTRAWEF